MAPLWLVDPTTLTEPPEGKRKIGRKPLIDLAGLQGAIRNGSLDEDDVWLGTTKAERDLENLRWTFEDALECIASLHRDDHKGAEWCEDRAGRWHPCDAYAIRYDDERRCRVRHSDFNYYLKFSLGRNGGLTLVLISCHV